MSISADNVTLSDLAARLDLLAESIAAPPKRWFGVAGSGEYCSLSEESIRRLLSSGKLTAHRPVKGKILIDRVELDALILGSTSTPRTGRGKGRLKA